MNKNGNTNGASSLTTIKKANAVPIAAPKKKSWVENN
jgi:hypothetical protein